MAKKIEDVKNTKTKKQTTTPAAKPVVKSRKTKLATTRKPAATAKSSATSKPKNSSSKKSLQADSHDYVVFGTVTYTDATPAAGLTVIAYDNDLSGNDTLGKPAVTTPTGSFSIPYTEADFRKTEKEMGGADVIVCIYNEKQELLFTSKKKNNAPEKYELKIKLPAQPLVVRGIVTDANQKPLANLTVRAFERDLRHPQFLGSGDTGLNGGFRIEYHLADFLLGEVPARRAPWLIVEVLEAPDGNVLSRQEVQKAGHDQTVSFTLASIGTVSEWQRIGEAVAPLLKGQGTPSLGARQYVSDDKNKSDLAPFDLNAADIDFIVLETGLNRAAVDAWAVSSRMLQDALLRITEDYATQQIALRENGWPFFYGLARQDLARDLDAVLRESPAKWQQTWRAALAAKQVPALDEKQVELVMDALTLLQRMQHLDPARSGNSDFAKVLANSALPMPAAVALDALTIYQEKGLSDPAAFLQVVEKHPDAEVPINTFVRGVRVHQLVAGHEGLSRILNARLEGASDSIAPLAAMRSTAWLSLADEAAVSPGLALRVQAQAERLHPLTALQAKLVDGDVQLPGVTSGEVAALLKNDGATVEAIVLGKKPIRDKVGVVIPDSHKALRDVGRFMRTGINMEAAADLMGKGIKTPAVASRYGREHIREQLRDKFPKEAGDEVVNGMFEVVEPILNGANGFIIDVAGNHALPLSMKEEYKIPLPESVRENLPTLPGLFGDLDECICKPCDSMLGQPAYLVDLLNLLGKNQLLWLLKQRRPGIFTLPLSCENADPEKAIQHIDIVLEVLEKAVAAAASGAAPLLIHRIAYEKLASAIFTWRLPFSLPYAETKAYLAKLGVSRFDLMSLRSNPQAYQLAAETLDLSFPQQWPISEWRLLTEKRTGAELWQVYGLDRLGVSGSGFPLFDPASGEDISRKSREEVLTRVSVLIDIIGLELDDLEKVLATRFVSGIEGELRLSNRNQCKTSEMRVLAKGSGDILRPVVALEGCLDRLHRFTRLLAKLPGWSITQLDEAIDLCGGIEMEVLVTTQNREDLLVKLAIIKRLHDDHNLPLDYLLDQPISALNLRKSLGLSTLQFNLFKTLTGFDPTTRIQSFNWAALEEFCNAAKRIHESGLSVEQVAQALLTRSQLIAQIGELPPSIKTDEQIEKLLKSVQQRLRSVVAIGPDQTLESQAMEMLSGIYDATTADKLVKAIRDAGAEKVVDRVAHLDLLPTLCGDTISRDARKLGEWSPLLPVNEATEILAVATANNFSTDTRLQKLLEGIATRRRERELIAVIAEQCVLSEPEVISLLGSRLWLAPPPAQGQPPVFASVAFLSSSFWDDVPSSDPADPPSVPSMTSSTVPLLHAWMDRLYRLIILGEALKVDHVLMLLADRIVVGSASPQRGINWSHMLAALPASGSAWTNPNWQVLLDLVWLQQPEQLSLTTFSELLSRLDTLARTGTQTVTIAAVRPLATRLEITDEQTLEVAKQVVTVTADSLRDPRKLRRVFKLLVLAKRLGASDTQVTQIANLDDITQAATTANALLETRISEQAHKEVWQSINDKLRQQRRDALVAYLVGNIRLDTRHYKTFRNANDLYEYYLIDPQMEPCFETTRILEAITATQLFAQRLLFGLEAGQVASKELKDRWTWMRNYRVWEANRKVFLFPENWLFPELRDDKSSSFKQLESALGQGELTQDLANQSFGQFLDDVAQMGQIKVLGMYEDVARVSTGILLDSQRFPLRRILYAVGRTQNPPYAYFWRRCVDFGSPHMEWAPWQRIELDVQGDHVMPFVLGGELHVAWPLIRNIKGDSKDIKDEWEAKLAWSRHDGKSWRKSSISRDFWRAEAQPFSDERESFSFRCETSLSGDLAKIFVYALAKIPGSLKTKPPSDMGPLQEFVFNDTTHYPYPSSASDALEIRNLVSAITSVAPHTVSVDTLEKFRHHYAALPDDIRIHVEVYWMTYGWWRRRPDPYTLHGGSVGYGTLNGNGTVFSDPPYATNYHLATLLTYPEFITDVEFLSDIRFLLSDYLDKYLTLRIGDFPSFMRSLGAACSRRVIFCYVWIRVKTPSGAADDLLPLDGSKGIFSCVIEGENLTPRQHRDITKLGGQAEATYGLTLTVGTRTLPSTTDETLAAVPAGKLANQKLRFEIDGRDLTKTQLEELGINFDSLRTLALVSEFRLTRDDSVAVLFGDLLQRNGATLGKWVDSSQLWMNGYKETEMNPPPPLKIIISQGYEVPIFDSWGPGPLSAPSPFWAVGSATSQPYTMFPLAWHCSENGISRYVDLGYVAGLANNGLFVYPDSYKEATVRRSYWSEYQALEALPAKQLSNFSANEAPLIAGNLQTTDWTDVAGGLLGFDARMPYACYNWEVFFHAPLLIADQLTKQHKFEDAERWLRYVFDPTSGGDGTDAKRFLKFRVFQKLDLNKQVIDLLTALAQVAGGFSNGTDAETVKIEAANIEAVKKLINRWRDAPFRPFLIARRRHIAFLWRTLFAYLDNLLAWADSLYRRDTIESINEATMLYVLAERILGRRPQLHEGGADRPAFTYEEKMDKWDEFANYWIDVGTRGYSNLQTARRLKDNINQPNPEGSLYFCMPFNDKITSYWGIVEARLANVRNCRNIDGIRRTLPLMDAEIDVELLVRATAAGLDLSEVISGLYAPSPHYRYSILSARAAELANETKSLGAAMLSAIEKRDAEHLAQLRSSNEISLLKLVLEVRTLQITEAERNIEALRGSRRSVGTRYNQYQRLLGKKDIKVPKEHESGGDESMLGRASDGASGLSNLGLIDAENQQIEHLDIAYGWTVAGGVIKGVAGIAHAAGAALNPAGQAFTATGTSLSTIGDMFELVSRGWQNGANRQSILGGHLRRRDEWAFQSNQSLKELQQIDKQILANEIRIDITKKELKNHSEQIEQAKAVDEVMRSKFSNEQLYEWMRTELYRLYSNTYRMALEMARRAERAAARELGVKPLNILRNDHWDSLRDGLLAGERLHQDIKRLEIAYLDQNRREFELTKHISLKRLNPVALANLRVGKTTVQGATLKKFNECEFEINEWLFDLDTPGHYLRRIKSVSVSIPCVAGPYSSVNCKLTLVSSNVRHDRGLKENSRYLRLTTANGGWSDDDRFTDYYGASEAIVTSTANADSGLFETQLRDERFLPFEGSGVISKWRLELPAEYPQFDYLTISDVVLSIRYTARDGGDSLREGATDSIAALLNPPQNSNADPLLFPVVLSCRSDFSTEWARADTNTPLDIPITRNLLPYWMEAARVGNGQNITKLKVLKVSVANLVDPPTALAFSIVWPPTNGGTGQWPADALDANGVGKGKLGTVDKSVIEDRIVLLSIGL